MKMFFMKRIVLLATILFAFTALFAQDATTLYNDGLKLKLAKSTAAALDKFKKAAELKPGYTEAMYEMSWCQNELKDYKGALATLKKVRPAWSTVPKVHFEIGYAFEKLEQYDSAVKAYNMALAIKPDYANVYKQLGYVAYTKEDYAGAMNAFEKYEAAKKDTLYDYLYWYRKGYCYNTQKEYEKAKLSLFKSLAYNNTYINTFLELGFACSKLKQDDAAIDYYNQAIAIDPKNHVPYNGIGEVYRDNKKDIAQAMSWYGKTLAINPNERKGNFGMGYCLNSSQKYADAIVYLKKAIQFEPTYTAAYVELGYSYFKTNEYSLALTNFNKAIELSASNENARYYKGLLFIAQNNKAMAQQMVDELKSLNSKNAASLQDKVSKMN